MNPLFREYLFWGMAALLLLIPFVMIALMPPSRVRELLLRCFIGIALISVGVVCALAAMAPHALPHSYSLGAYTFYVLAAALILIPSVLLFFMPQSRLRDTLLNGLLWLVGAVALVLGIIGAVLPVVPTTPFILVTAACWGRASPRFHRWLHRHRYFGPMVRNWEERRAIPRRAKYLAWTMMSISSIAMIVRFPERWYVGAVIGAVCLCVGLWMAKLPDA